MTTEELIQEAIKKGITCRSCWWQEGGRCYKEPVKREKQVPGQIGRRSLKMADKLCEHYTSKRSVLQKAFGDIPITIISEKNGK